MSTPTPRTDAKVVICNYGEERVTADFARTLERELNEARNAERLARVQLDAARAQRDALLEITWLDTPDTPHETAAQWRAEFDKNWERKVVCDRLRAEVERLSDIINRSSVQFFHDGTDGETAAKMLTVLNEAKP